MSYVLDIAVHDSCIIPSRYYIFYVYRTKDIYAADYYNVVQQKLGPQVLNSERCSSPKSQLEQCNC